MQVDGLHWYTENGFEVAKLTVGTGRVRGAQRRGLVLAHAGTGDVRLKKTV